MEPNQVNLVAAAVPRDSQQIIHALEPRFARQIVRDVVDGNRRNRIHHDVALVHPVAPPHLYMRTRPDANGASDSPAPDSIAKTFGEQHVESHPAAAGSRRARHRNNVRMPYRVWNNIASQSDPDKKNNMVNTTDRGHADCAKKTSPRLHLRRSRAAALASHDRGRGREEGDERSNKQHRV